MTSLQSVMAAFAIILLDLLSRAGLDKVLALAGSPAVVALWAQLQSAVELVSAVTLAGVLQGLTVMVAQTNETRDERHLLRAALKLGLGTSLAVALIVAAAVVALASPLTQDKIARDLFWLAALAGCITILPATLNAYWLGNHQQLRMLRLALLTNAVWWLVAAGAGFGLTLRGLMWVQCVALAFVGIAVWCYLRRLTQPADTKTGETETLRELVLRKLVLRKLVRFVPAGLAIGIMGPVSMLLMRGILSGTLSWDEVGYLQALWRCGEWVTATAAGVLSLIFLPRFSSRYGSVQFKREMLRAGAVVLLPSACLLLLIYLNQRALLAMLYDTRFTVSNETAALFILGSWIRIASWLFLFGLFAAHRTRLIVAGEFFSLPLYALLLWLFADGMTLERSALLFLASYVVYLCFNAIGLLYTPARANPATQTARH